MFTTISDNPGAATGVIGVFIAAALALFTAFGGHLTQEQITAILSFVAALYALLTWVLHKTTVAATPSSTAAPIQAPPPGTSLVLTSAASAPGPVPASATLAQTP